MWGHSTCSLRIVSAHSTYPCKHTHRHTHTIFESPQMQSFLLVRIRDLISTGPRQRAATVNIWFYLNYTTWDLLKPWLKHLSCKNAHSWKRTDMQSWCLCSLAVCELSYMWTCYPCETLTLIVKLITFHHFLFVKKKNLSGHTFSGICWKQTSWDMSTRDSSHYFWVHSVPFVFLFVQYKHAILARALQLLAGPQPQDANTLACLVILYHC